MTRGVFYFYFSELEVYDLHYGPVFIADLLCDLGIITLHL